MKESTARRDILLMNLAVFLWGAGDGLFMYIQPLYIEDLGANPAQIGGLLSLMRLATALTYIPSGYLSDRLPRKPLLMGGWVLGLISILICALAPNWQILIPGLLLYGLSAYSIPVVNAYLAEATEGRNLEAVLASNLAAYTAGTVLFPTIGGLLADALSMRAVYLAAAGVFAVSIVVVTLISPQKPQGVPERLEGWRLLVGSRFRGFVLRILLTFLAMYLIFPLAPNFLVEVRDMSKSRVGMLGSLASIGTTVIALFLGRFRNHRRQYALLLGQGMVWVAAALLLWTPGIGSAAFAFFLRGAYPACQVLTQARGAALFDDAHRGIIMASIGMFIIVTQVLGSVAAGWLYASDPARPFVVALALIPLGALLAWKLPNSDQV